VEGAHAIDEAARHRTFVDEAVADEARRKEP
jgi:hypothetical protein